MVPVAKWSIAAGLVLLGIAGTAAYVWTGFGNPERRRVAAWKRAADLGLPVQPGMANMKLPPPEENMSPALTTLAKRFYKDVDVVMNHRNVSEVKHPDRVKVLRRHKEDLDQVERESLKPKLVYGYDFRAGPSTKFPDYGFHTAVVRMLVADAENKVADQNLLGAVRRYGAAIRITNAMTDADIEHIGFLVQMRLYALVLRSILKATELDGASSTIIREGRRLVETMDSRDSLLKSTRRSFSSTSWMARYIELRPADFVKVSLKGGSDPEFQKIEAMIGIPGERAKIVARLIEVEADLYAFPPSSPKSWPAAHRVTAAYMKRLAASKSLEDQLPIYMNKEVREGAIAVLGRTEVSKELALEIFDYLEARNQNRPLSPVKRVDPISKKPYRRIFKNGAITLYGVGTDGIDNKGKTKGNADFAITYPVPPVSTKTE